MSSAAATAPTVSVCIPTYRGGAHLAATLASVLAQTFTDFELLVIDDGSPDDTLAIARRCTDARIRVLQNPRNLGPQGNWNRCLEEARGRYVKLLPQDDVMAPTLLARQVEVLDADTAGSVALVFCARHIIDASGRVIFSKGLGGASGPRDGRALVRRSIRAGTNLIGEPGGVLFRRALAERVGRFDASIGYVVDLDYWARLLLHGSGHYLADRLVSFRISSASWSVAIGRHQAVAFTVFIARIAAQPGFGLGRFDALCGTAAARLNNLARLLVYRLVIRPAGRTAASAAPSAESPLP